MRNYNSGFWETTDCSREVHLSCEQSVVSQNPLLCFQRVAMRKNGVLTYLHADHLGSTVLETNASGAVTSDEKYKAYGKQRDTGTVSTDHRFTGQKEDASGLQYFNARFYDPVTGMFVSPDTIVPQPGLVLAYDRYMYAFGNPMSFVDPNGHEPCANGSMCQPGGPNGYGTPPTAPNPLWQEYIKGEMSCSNGSCGISFDMFLASKTQYSTYKAHPYLYDIDTAIINHDIKGDTRAAEKRQQLALVYATYWTKVQPDIDIHAQIAFDAAMATGALMGSLAKDLAGSRIHVVEVQGSTALLSAEGANGDIYVLSDMYVEGDKLYMTGTHVQGQGSGTSSIGELRSIAQELGRQLGVNEVVVQGAERTSGANPGRQPRPIIIKVK